MGIGVPMGVGIGAALDDLPSGFGIAIGAGLGAVFGTRRNK
jgi:hypothetical protein